MQWCNPSEKYVRLLSIDVMDQRFNYDCQIHKEQVTNYNTGTSVKHVRIMFHSNSFTGQMLYLNDYYTLTNYFLLWKEATNMFLTPRSTWRVKYSNILHINKLSILRMMAHQLTNTLDVVPRVIMSPSESAMGSLQRLSPKSGLLSTWEFKRVPFRLPISTSSHVNFCHQWVKLLVC